MQETLESLREEVCALKCPVAVEISASGTSLKFGVYPKSGVVKNTYVPWGFVAIYVTLRLLLLAGILAFYWLAAFGRYCLYDNHFFSDRDSYLAK